MHMPLWCTWTDRFHEASLSSSRVTLKKDQNAFICLIRILIFMIVEGAEKPVYNLKFKLHGSPYDAS